LSRTRLRRSLFAGLVLAFLLHNDLWLWNDGRLVWGLPTGLTYHVAYCAAVSVLMGLLVRLAWPFEGAEATDSPNSGEERPR